MSDRISRADFTPEQERHYAQVHEYLRNHAVKAGRCTMPLFNDVSRVECNGGAGGTEWARRMEHPWTWTEDDFDADKFVELCHPCHVKYDLPSHCPQGHRFTEENTYVTPSGSRQCRTCNRVAKARWYRRNQGKGYASHRAWRRRRPA